jgi:hypothetical protein
MKNNSEEKAKEKVEFKKLIHSIIKNEVKPIKVEKTVAKPISISKPKSEPIVIVKPKEITISKVETQPIIISKKQEPIEITTNNNPVTNDKATNVSKETEKQKADITIEVPTETKYTNIVQQTEEITHFKVFQEEAISQEQFTKETTFSDNYAPNLDNPKQFNICQTVQLRKEMEDAYIKEEDDVWIKGEWVKAKAIYDRSKTNKEVTEYTPSFRKIIPENMNSYLLSIYTDTMDAIVNEYKEKRKKEAAIRKREKKKKNK